MNATPTVFILVLNYNGRATILSCLRSLFHLDYSNFKVIFIDNASTDGSFEIVKQQYSYVHCIRNSENVGFARGINVGIRFALDHGADFVWLMNPDAEPQRGALSRLVALFLKHPRVGVVSPLVLTPSRKVWFGGGMIHRSRMRAVHVPMRSRTIPFETGFVSGCAMMIRSTVFRSIGLLDERFFLYYEDADFSLRAKRAGFRVVVHPKIHTIHSEESRHNKAWKTYWLVRSGLFFFRKHTPFLLHSVFWMTFLARWGRSSVRAMRDDDEETLAVQEAFRDFWRYGY